MEEKRIIEQYFRTKYLNQRYVIKNYFHMEDIFEKKGQKLFVIEFIDTEVKHPKTMELQVKEYELLTIKQ